MLVRDLVEDRKADFTTAERRVIPFLKNDSLVIELQSITKLADAAEVSTPTVIRLARKLGFDGFPDLQSAIRSELAERIKQPLAKLKADVPGSQTDHIVNQFAHKIVKNVNQTLAQLDYEKFEEVATLLADRSYDVKLIGGRITRPVADHFANHLHIQRPNVSLLTASQNQWPQAILDMSEKTILIIFDIRRYERKFERLAQLAAARNVKVVLFTDQWGSPIENVADFCFRSMVQVPSSWDSMISLNFIVETIVAQIHRKAPEDTVKRIADLETLISDTEMFEK